MSIRVRFTACFLAVLAVTTVGPDGVRANRSDVPRDAAASLVKSGKLLTVGYFSTCLGLNDGTVKCWGDNTYGQIGNGATGGYVTAPTAVTGLSNVREIVSGAYHVCALLADTTVKCWGYNIAGQLGVGDTTNSNVPVSVKTPDGNGVLTGVASISASYFTTCASMVADGSVYCWGDQWGGGLGNGSTSFAFVRLPDDVQIAGGLPLTGIIELSSGMSATCGISTSATLYCWGMADWAAGDGSNTKASYAKQVPGLTGVKSVSSGGSHVCALATGGAYCWGGSSDHPFGFTDVVTGPTLVAASPSLVRADGVGQIVAGNNSTCIVQTTKKVECVGSLKGDDGFTKKSATGGNESGTTSSFSGVPGTLNSSVVAAGADHICALTGAGLLCWGRNDYAQLGGGSATTENLVATLAVASQPQVVTFSEVAAKNVASDPFDVSATADSGRPVHFAIAPESSAVCSITGATVTILDAGDCVVNATADPEAMYAEGTASKTVAVAALAPIASTGDASDLTMSAAKLSGSVNPRGATSTLAFEYGTDSALTSSASATVKVSQTGNSERAVSVDLSGLGVATTYYYRLVATNSVGVTNGAIKSFTTKGSKPTAVTGSATRSSSGMTVSGKVNPKDLETTVRFEYGTDPKLIGAQQTAARTQTGGDDVDVSAAITALVVNTTYYYRIVAANAVGVAEGEIKSFTTTRAEGVSINDGDEFTSSENVIVSVVGPSTAVKAILSNDGGFATSETFDLVNNSADISWKLQSSREGTFTKIVYVKYVTRFGSQSTPYTDDIILDTTKPVMTSATAAASTPSGSAVTVARLGASAKKASGGVRLSLKGSDTISGIGVVEIRSSASKPTTKVVVSRFSGKTDGKPRATSQTISLKSTAKRLQVRVVDRAGNASAWRTIIVR